MIQFEGTMIGISGIDNFINFPFKMANSYLKKLSKIDTKKIDKDNMNNLFIDAGLNMIDKEIGSGITLGNNKIWYHESN